MDCCAHEGPARGDARFDIKKVADGVHVAVAAPAYKVNSNTAIIESDDGVMVVDTHSKPSAARVVIAHLRELTSKPVRYVVNTHFHWDHWHGNEVYPQAYPHAEIVTNDITREAMVKKGLKRIQDHVRQVPAEIAKLEADVAAARGEARTKLENDLRLARAYLAEVKALKPALPTIQFERTMKLYRGDPCGREWLTTFRGYVRDMVDGVRREVAAGATLDEVKARVPAALAGTYEKPFSKYGDYRPWRTGILANIERTYAMVS